MAYTTMAARMSQQLVGNVRGMVGTPSAQASAMQPQPPAQSAVDKVQEFDNQRISRGTEATTPGGTVSEPAQAPQTEQKDASVALNPVAGAKEVTAGVDAGDRALNFNSRLTGMAQEKQKRDAARSRQGGGPGGPIGAGRQGVIDLASTYLGSRYQMGGNNYAGIDCSGLVQQVYSQFGFNLPRLAADQAAVAGMRTSVNNLRPGDLVAWGDGSHIAIYAGNGQIIQAANPRQGVIRSNLSEQTNQNYYGVALRFAGE